MQYNYKEWHKKKKNIEEEQPNELIIHKREIWWCNLGLNIGDEENGKGSEFERPVLIMKKFNNRLCWILPLTSQPGNPNFYIKIFYSNRCGYVITSQLRAVSVKRLRRLITRLSYSQFKELKKCTSIK